MRRNSLLSLAYKVAHIFLVSGRGVRQATQNLLLLKVQAMLVRIFKPEDEHCEIVTGAINVR